MKNLLEKLCFKTQQIKTIVFVRKHFIYLQLFAAQKYEQLYRALKIMQIIRIYVILFKYTHCG